MAHLKYLLQSKVKAIVEYFHRCTVGSAKFSSIQAQMITGEPLKLKMDVVTRWDSIYHMFQRMCELQEPLNATLGVLNNPVEPLNDADWKNLKSFCTILKPFHETTEEMSAEKNTSVSKVLLIVRGLQRLLQKIRLTATQDELTLVENLIKNISVRFPNIEGNLFFAQPTYLDPRFKKKGFTNDSALKICKDSLLQSMARYRSIDETIAEEPTPLPIQNADSIWAEFDKSVASNVKTSTSSSLIELRQYNEDEMIPRTSDPLLWWKSREILYPTLSKIAKKRLCAPATSVPSERVFSKAGQLISERRSRLKSGAIEKILFLNANFNKKNI